MKSQKTTLGGALAALGTFLFGAPVVINATSVHFPSAFLVTCMIAGFILQALGIFFAHFWAADSQAVDKLQEQVSANRVAIDTTIKAAETGDTSHLRRDVANAQTVANFSKP